MTSANKDPRTKYPKPPFDSKPQNFPGKEGLMDPPGEFGEESYRASGKLEGRSALITGADSGIGRAVAVAFAKEGADIAIAYLDEHEDAEKTRQLVEGFGKKAILLPGNIGNQEFCESLISKTVSEFGKLDVLVNNAAYQKPYKSLDDVTAEELEKTFQVNLFATFYLCRAGLKVMKPGGSIINTASIQAYDPSPEIIVYAASKASIVNFTKNFSSISIKSGVRANAVAPGPIWTPFIPSAISEEKMHKFGEKNPTGRPGQPAELGGVYVLLAGEDGSYINGETIGVTGGELLS